MTGRPITYLNWTDGDPSKVFQPPGPIALRGWVAGEAPPFDYMNWLFYYTDLWIKYFDAIVTTGEPDQVMRFVNGGFWKWNAATGVLSWSLDANMSIPGVPDANNRLPAGNVTINDGQIAYVTINVPIIASGDVDGSTNVIQNVNFTANIAIGMSVSGPGIPPSTVVTGVAPGSVTLNNNTTSPHIGSTYIFCASTTLVATAVDESTWIPSLPTIMFAKRSGNILYWGVNTTQMTFLDGEFKQNMRQGYFSTFDGVAGENLSQGDLVYISAGNPTDPGRTAGRLYKLDVSAANQLFRGTFAGISASTVLSGANTSFMGSGFFKYSSLTSGANYYADPNTPGAITVTAPTNAGQKILIVGVAVNTTDLLVDGVGGVSSPPPGLPIYKTDSFGPDIAGTTTLALTSSPVNKEGVVPYYNGLMVSQDEFTMSGDNVVLNTPVASSTDKVAVRYLLAQQSYLVQKNQVAVDQGDHQHYDISFAPVSTTATDVYVDGLWQDPSLWTLTIGAGVATVNFASAISSTSKVSVVAVTSAIG